MFIPVSRNISKKVRTKKPIPKIPNCAGVKILAKIAIFRKDKILVIILKEDIHDMPVIVVFVYPIFSIEIISVLAL